MSMVIGITRIRNESLIIADTIRHMEEFCDALIVYDDCSTDNTLAAVKASSRKLYELIEGDEWRADRQAEETRHRSLLYDRARRAGADWVFAFDADERYEGPIRDIIDSGTMDGLRVGLFDAYLTAEFSAPYTGGDLGSLPRLFGPEERRILMAWRACDGFWFEGRDKRQPNHADSMRVGLDAPVFAKHYGKALSVDHWEETCQYYMEHFPEPYKSKWAERRGKALHTLSDYERPLYQWPDVIERSVRVYPQPQRLLSSVPARLKRRLKRR